MNRVARLAAWAVGLVYGAVVLAAGLVAALAGTLGRHLDERGRAAAHAAAEHLAARMVRQSIPAGR